MGRAVSRILLLLLSSVGVAHAQIPHIAGTWKMNMEASEYPGPKPQSQVRQYFLTDDDFLVGLAVTIDAEGNPSFLQFAGKTDGNDYPEYSVRPLAQFQISGTVTPLTYSERQRDQYTVEWFDKYDGNTYASGTRSVSPDGRTMTVVAEIRGPDGKVSTFTIVYDRVTTAE